jgi:ABC-type sugar transport system substrate-binding protein
VTGTSVNDARKIDEAVGFIGAFESGKISRSDFLRRGGAFGLSAATMLAVAGCGSSSSSSSTSASSTAAKSAGSSDLASIQKLVYPSGFTSDSTYQGPHGGSLVAFLPSDYWSGTTPAGHAYVRDWKFLNFKSPKKYRIAFGSFSYQWSVAVELADRMQLSAEKLGVEVTKFNNNFDANQAISNAQLMAQQRFDYVLQSQIFPAANQTIYRTLSAAGIPSMYFAVPGPGPFFDPGNFRMFDALGKWVANYAKQNWGGRVDLVIDSAQPRAGSYVGQRDIGFWHGVKSVLPSLPSSRLVQVDGAGLLTQSQQKAADVLTSHAGAKYILGKGDNDDSGVGVANALAAAGLTDTSAVCGQFGQISAYTELKKPKSAFKVSAMSDLESVTWMLSIAILQLMGGKISPVNFYPYTLVTHETINQQPPNEGVFT